LRRPASVALLRFGIGTSRESCVGCHNGSAQILFVTGSVALCFWPVKTVVNAVSALGHERTILDVRFSLNDVRFTAETGHQDNLVRQLSAQVGEVASAVRH
jgi:hypothetical protein